MAEERQTNYTIAEDYYLPSKGLIYDKKVEPHIELRSMTARDEMKRQSPSSTQFKTLADIIEGCMIEKPAVHVYDMALGDYEFLLHKLRIVTYGSDYKVYLQCPNCGETIEPVANLEMLNVKDFDFERFKELSNITLPVSNTLIGIRFQTPRMLDESEVKIKELKRKFKGAEVSFDTLVLLKSVIGTVNGEVLTDTQLETFINKLPAKDMMKIINTVDELNALIGLENELVVDCDKCGGEVRTSFRFGQEFFRPSTI